MPLNSTIILTAIMLALPRATRQEANELASSVARTGDRLVLGNGLALIRTSNNTLTLERA